MLLLRYSQELDLPSLPEMVFPETTLELEHESGCVLSFVTLDALKPIDTTQEPLKVAAAKQGIDRLVLIHVIRKLYGD